MSFKELDADGLWHVLENELGADIATVIKDEELSGEDFLELTNDDVAGMFSKLGQQKKVIRLIKIKSSPTAEETPATGWNGPPPADEHGDIQVEAQAIPTDTASDGTHVGIAGKITAEIQLPHIDDSTLACSVEGKPTSSPLAQGHSPESRLNRRKLEEMAGNLGKLSGNNLFLLLSEKVDQDTATAIKDNGIQGDILVELPDNDLKEVIPKLGPRRMVKKLIDNFHRRDPSQPQMDFSLGKLEKEDLFLWLSEKVDEETAKTIEANKLSGADLLELSDAELKEVVLKMGPRIKLKKLIDSFKGTDTAQSKGAASLQQTSPTSGSTSPMVAALDDPPLKQATPQDDASEELASQTGHSVQKQPQAIPKAVVPPLPPGQKRLAEIIMEKSDCIQRGRQSIHKLKLKKIMEGKAKRVAKYQFGKRRRDSKEYFVMLVGATGAGKSTLINGIANYILGIEWEDPFRFKLIADEEVTSQAHSVTKCITAYSIHEQEGSRFPFTLTIVDTPGFGDTKGLESDKRLVAQIKEFFSIPGEEGIDRIHGIGFVTQASLARLTPTQRYIFDSILAIFGKDIGSNILMMTTFADGKKPPVLEAVDEAKIKYCRSFKFNNSAIFSEAEDDEDEDQSFEKMFWDMGMASFDTFFRQLTQMEARSLQLTKEVLEEREQLESIMESLRPQIKGILGRIDTLKQEQKIMEQHEADIKGNKDFIYTVTEPRLVQHDLTGKGIHVTNCLICNFTCHKRCKIPKNENKRGCIAMEDGYCKMCPKKCFWDQHRNTPQWFEVQEVTVKKTYEELKKRYEDAMTGKATKEKIVSIIRSEIVERYRQVFLMIRTARKILQRLDEIALRPNPLSEVEYIDLLIQSEQQQHEEGFMGRIQCLRTVREQAVLLSTVNTGEIFEDEALQQAQQLAEAEADKTLLEQAQQLADTDIKGLWIISTSPAAEKKGFWNTARKAWDSIFT